MDLNCDMGESYGAYTMGNDAELVKYISSANIACGFHAGDPTVMRKTVQLCLQHGVAIGAHPGLPDLAGFGRKWLEITPLEAYDLVLYQLGALFALVASEGGRLQHVKPHGALYHKAMGDHRFADAIAKAIYQFDAELIVFGWQGSELHKAGERLGLRCACEAFADRTYLSDGTLTPRTSAEAVILDADQAVRQALLLAHEQRVSAVTGESIPIQADTLCLHGDGLHAASFAQKINAAFTEAKIAIKALR